MYTKRIKYLQELRQQIILKGSKNIIYLDESGFDGKSYRNSCWVSKDKKIIGERSEKTLVTYFSFDGKKRQ